MDPEIAPLILFTQDGCPDSAQMRACLQVSGVPFVEHNLSHDPAAADALLATGLFATPVVVRGNRAMLATRRLAVAQAFGFRCRCLDLNPLDAAQ